jgi:hypothetical protein
MSIKEYEFFNGVVLNKIIRKGKPVKIDTFPCSSKNAFAINDKVGLYIKYSKKPTTPWRFSFLKLHQDEIKVMKEVLDEVFVIFVCQKDGFACLSYDELKKVLDEQHDEIEWISASRLKRESYTLKGSNGKLKFKINDNAFPKRIFELLN